MLIYQVSLIVNNPYDLDTECIPVGLFNTSTAAMLLHDTIIDHIQLGCGDDSYIDDVIVEPLCTGVRNDTLLKYLGFECRMEKE